MTSALAGALLAGLVPAEPAEAASAHQDAVERAIVERINAIRAQHGVPRLRVSRALSRAADAKAREILRSDRFSHTSPDGTPMAVRVRRYVKARAVGETIAATTHLERQATMIVRAWMSSPGHRATLLSRTYRRIGVGRRHGRLGAQRATVFAADLASAR
jgi:uncharacterized protein YkwD